MMNRTSQKIRLMDLNEIRILFGIIMGALCIVTILGNIIVIYKYRKTSMVGNLFIISLACADLIVGLFVMPVATVYAINEVWTLSLPVCLTWLSADYTASTASILNLLTLSLDRYWSITSPLEYLGKRTKSRALLMIGFAWSISLLWLVPITGWPYFFNDGQRTVPKDKCNTEYDKNIFFKISTAIINFYIPLIAMIAINTKIYLVIHKRYRNPILRYSSIVSNEMNTNKTKMNAVNRTKSPSICSSIEEENIPKKNSNTNTANNVSFTKQKYSFKSSNGKVSRLCRSKSKSVQNFQSMNNLNYKETKSDSNRNAQSFYQTRTDSQFSKLIKKPNHTEKQCNSSFMCAKQSQQTMSFIQTSSEKKQTKNTHINRKGLFMNKQEKAFKQLSSIVIGFTFCFTPYFIVFLIVAICENCVSDQVFTITVWFGYFNSTINPFLYALSNKKIKKKNNQCNKLNTTITSENCRKKSLKNSTKSFW